MEINNISDSKFRTITFAVTAVICVAIIVIGIVYIANLRERSNVDHSEQTTGTTVSETKTPEITTPVTTTMPETTTLVETTTAPETTEEAAFSSAEFDLDKLTIEDIEIKAKTSEDGCIFRWKCEEEALKKCLISIEITDGRSDYRRAGMVPLSAKHFEATAGNAADAISARISVSKPDGTVIFVKTISIANNTYAESSSTSRVDISSLFA